MSRGECCPLLGLHTMATFTFLKREWGTQAPTGGHRHPLGEPLIMDSRMKSIIVLQIKMFRADVLSGSYSDC